MSTRGIFDTDLEMLDGDSIDLETNHDSVCDAPTFHSIPTWPFLSESNGTQFDAPAASLAPVVGIAPSDNAEMVALRNKVAALEAEAAQREVKVQEELARAKDEFKDKLSQAEDEFQDKLSQAEDMYWQEKRKNNQLHEAHLTILVAKTPNLSDVERAELQSRMGITPMHTLELRNLEVIKEEQRRTDVGIFESRHNAHNLGQDIANLTEHRKTLQINIDTLQVQLNNMSLNVGQMQVKNLHLHYGDGSSRTSKNSSIGPDGGSSNVSSALPSEQPSDSISMGPSTGDSLAYRTRICTMPAFSQDCKYGAGCTSKKCGYAHPDQRGVFGQAINKLPKWKGGAKGAE